MNLDQIQRILSTECRLTKDQATVVGVSGGPDSLCLLTILHRLDYQLIVAHVNHQLRPESDSEENFVQDYCGHLNVPFVSTRVDVKEYALQKKMSIEESARCLRYSFLFETAEKNQAQALAVAHQADDQIETVLMHILRGAGSAGIKGMAYFSFLRPFSTSIPVVRPLLGVWREEITVFCAENGIKSCADQTNSDTRYFRNRIRQELIPILSTYNSQAKQHIWQMAQLVQEEDACLEEEVKAALEGGVTAKGKGFFVFSREEFSKFHPAIQRRILRSILSELRADLRDIGFEAVDKGTSAMTLPDFAGEIQLLENVWISSLSPKEVFVYTNRADFSEIWPTLEKGKSVPLVIPGLTLLNEHWQIRVHIREEIPPEDQPTDANECFFDLDELQGELQVTTPKTGQRISPFGKQDFSQKLSDLFINSGLHRKARSGWPLVCCGGKILWVVGIRRGKEAPVTSFTKRTLVLRLERR
jgi:tRNA(Ile)-lysidine synthase